jgi:hypothetical protein
VLNLGAISVLLTDEENLPWRECFKWSSNSYIIDYCIVINCTQNHAVRNSLGVKYCVVFCTLSGNKLSIATSKTQSRVCDGFWSGKSMHAASNEFICRKKQLRKAPEFGELGYNLQSIGSHNLNQSWDPAQSDRDKTIRFKINYDKNATSHLLEVEWFFWS